MANNASLSFDDGYRNIEINGDPNRVIRINPTDTAFIKRLSSLNDRINEISEKYKDIDFESIEKLKDIDLTADDGDAEFEQMKKAADNIDKMDKAIRELIDSIFETPICDIVFGDAWCISPANGQPIYINFLEALSEYIRAEMGEKTKQSVQKVSKYSAAAQELSPNRQQRRNAKKKGKKKNKASIEAAPSKPAIDINNMSSEELRALMVQISNKL